MKNIDDARFDGPPRLSQALTVLLLQAGKLYEGWGMMKAAYFAGPVGREYANRLDSDTKQALDELRRYFGNGNNHIKQVRHAFGFHYDLDAIDRALSPLSERPESEIYVGHHHLNTFYAISEVALQESVARELNADDPQAGAGDLMDDTANVTGLFLNFIDGFTHTLLERYTDLGRFSEEIDVTQWAANEADVDLPYFVKNPTRPRR